MRPPRDRQGQAPSSREGRGKPALKDDGPGKRSRPPAPQGQGPLGEPGKGSVWRGSPAKPARGRCEERAKTAKSAPVNERRSTMDTRDGDSATPATSLSRRRVSKRGGLPLGAGVSAPRVGGLWRRSAIRLSSRVRHCPLFLGFRKTTLRIMRRTHPPSGVLTPFFWHPALRSSPGSARGACLWVPLF